MARSKATRPSRKNDACLEKSFLPCRRKALDRHGASAPRDDAGGCCNALNPITALIATVRFPCIARLQLHRVAFAFALGGVALAAKFFTHTAQAWAAIVARYDHFNQIHLVAAGHGFFRRVFHLTNICDFA